MKQINYLFDPLCGWCYGVSKGIRKLAETAHITLIPTGLFSHDRLIDDEFARYAWQNDQRIQQLTGLPFSEAYRQQILGKPTNFNSFPLVVALTAVQQTAPERELDALNAFQQARYQTGLDTAQMPVLTEILLSLGLNDASALLSSPALIEQAKQRIANGKALAQQLHIQGVPSVYEQKDTQWLKIDNSLLMRV